MKNIIKFGLIILVAACFAAVFSSCEDVLALGEKLNLDGPRLNIDKPVSRQPVDGRFVLSGTINDKTDIDRILVKVRYSTPADSNALFYMQWRYTINGPAASANWEVSEDFGVTWTPSVPVDVIDRDEFDNPVIKTATAEWDGSAQNAIWTVPIDLLAVETPDRFPQGLPDGQYQFSVTAWNTAGNSDANSYKTRTVILYKNPPKVDIINPVLFTNREDIADPSSKIGVLYNLPGAVANRQNPAYIGTFLNGVIPLQWQINTINDVWAIDIRFYKVANDSVPFIPDYTDDDPSNVAAVEDYVYRMYMNLPDDRPSAPNAEKPPLKPNGKAEQVPNLATAPTLVETNEWLSHDPDVKIVHYLKENITEKTTLQVVVRCQDAAGLWLDDEYKFRGYFVYWPDSDIPWIDLSSLEKPSPYDSTSLPQFHPNKEIPIRAYDDTGVEYVKYSIYSADITGNKILPAVIADVITPPPAERKTPRPTILPWEIVAPPEAGDYIIEADVYDVNGKAGSTAPFVGVPSAYTGYFKVLDVSMPDLKMDPAWPASDPIFNHINLNPADGSRMDSSNMADWHIQVKGTASHLTGVKSVYMVWINPKSANYAAMSQLSYFRDAAYEGWQDAEEWIEKGIDVGLTKSPPWPAQTESSVFLDYNYSALFPNKLWKLDLGAPELNEQSGRKEYAVSKTVNLNNLLPANTGSKNHLNIAPGRPDAEAYDDLKSQVFVLKVTDTDESMPGLIKGKSTIITWAPQGDAVSPVIKIDRVEIQRQGPGSTAVSWIPGDVSDQIPQFLNGGEIITVRGTWTEDSTASLNIIQTVLKNCLEISLNGNALDNTKNTTKTVYLGTNNEANTARGTSGTWVASGTVNLLGVDEDGHTRPDPGTHKLVAENLKDVLSVNAVLTDVGGNISEDQASWLIESDKLRLLRVGSDTSDGTYTTKVDGDPTNEDMYIDIFLEFNKPVKLKDGRSVNPQLGLNLTSNASPTVSVNAAADYYAEHPDHAGVGGNGASTHQHFRYRVVSPHTTENTSVNPAEMRVMNLSGLPGETAAGAALPDAYPWTWETVTTQGREEIAVMVNNHPDKTGVISQKLPITSTVTDTDYLKTLMAGKHLRIDTDPPRLAPANPITVSGRGGFFGQDNYIYIALKFSESVFAGTGADMPKLRLSIANDILGTTDVWTSDPPLVNNDTITFSYEIQDGDYTWYNSVRYGNLYVTGFGGKIIDLAKNSYNSAGFATVAPMDSSTPVQGIRVKAIKPATPILKVENKVGAVYNLVEYKTNTAQSSTDYSGLPSWEADIEANMYPDSDTFNSVFPDSAVNPTNIIKLENQYIDNIHILITPAGTPGVDYDTVEYSLNYGVDWSTYYKIADPPAAPVAPTDANRMEKFAQGNYDITCRQTDMAGNVSDWSKPITFFWDKGDLLTRISSDAANGIYTNTTAAGGSKIDVIPIKLSFRKPVRFTQNPTFRFSSVRTDDLGSKQEVTVNLSSNPAYSTVSTEFSFDYVVGPYDTTQGQRLDLEAILNLAAVDDKGVDVSSLINLGLVTVKGTLLKDLKDIKIQTGSPKRTLEPYFYNDTSRPNSTVQTSPNFQGVKTEDDSAWTTMLVEFDRNIYKGSAELYNGPMNPLKTNKVTIIQSREGYRIPAVLSEAQWSLYKDKVSGIEDYYTVGTNGYKEGVGPDTSTKYILKFNIDPYSFQADPSGSALEQLAESFRLAEAVELLINSSFIEVNNVGDTHRVYVRLSSSYALKVPGAKYEIKFPAGFVQDLLGNPCEQYPPAEIDGAGEKPFDMSDDDWLGIRSAGGVSRPFIRYYAQQDAISVSGSPSASQPRLTATQPGTAYIRMDSRTPASVVRYVENAVETTAVTTANVTTADWATGDNPATYGPANDPGGTNWATQPTATSNPYGNASLTPAAVTPLSRGPGSSTGNNLTILNGYKLRIRAKGAVGTTISAASSDEMLYRTVVSFTGATGGGTNITFDSGDQVWIRGGDTLYGATIPGFPLSSTDNYSTLGSTGKRAGIRLMTRANTNTATLALSTWQWVTWDVKTLTYITLYKGHDADSTAAEAYWYGPLAAYTQSGNWSQAKDCYALMPGGHRRLNSQNPDYTNYKGSNTPPFVWLSVAEERPATLVAPAIPTPLYP